MNGEREDFQHDPADDVHMIFEGQDQPEHGCTPGCWCAPEVEYVDEFTGKIVWLHRIVH